MGLGAPPIGSYIAHSVRLTHSRKGTEAMAEFVAYTLDGEASKTWVRPISRITGIEVREDRVLVISFFQGNPVVVQCGTQAEQLAREIMAGLATTPPLKQGNRL